MGHPEADECAVINAFYANGEQKKLSLFYLILFSYDQIVPDPSLKGFKLQVLFFVVMCGCSCSDKINEQQSIR